ncbi:MAG: hypothetical protein ACOCQN_02485 [Halanaerobiaceae bacterium]
MPRKGGFIVKEILRNARLNSKKLLRHFFFLALSYMLIIIIIISSVNLNYYKQIIKIMSVSFNISWIPVFKDTEYMRLLLIFSFIVFLYFFIRINRVFITENIKFYCYEINLIKMLNADNMIIKKPIIYTAIIINTLSLFAVINIIKFFYSFIYLVIDQSYSNKILQFNYYDTSLFVFLLIITSLVLILTAYFIFYRKRVI